MWNKSVSLSQAMSINHNITASFLQPSSTSPYVPVPDRNQILIRRVFWAHHWVWRAIALSFRWRWVSYTLHRCIRYHVFTHFVLAPPLVEAQHNSATNSVKHSKYATASVCNSTKNTTMSFVSISLQQPTQLIWLQPLQNSNDQLIINCNLTGNVTPPGHCSCINSSNLW